MAGNQERALPGPAEALDEVEAELRLGGIARGHVRQVTIEEELSGTATAFVLVEGGLDPDGLPDLLEGSAELTLSRAGAADGPRRFCGLVRRIERGSALAGRETFWFHLQPAFAALDDQPTTRPFVGLSAIEILRQVLVAGLGALGRQVDFRLIGRAPQPPGTDVCPDGFLRRDLCVQYGETTYAYCRRLMAEEGLAHFYDHSGPREQLVVAGATGFASSHIALNEPPGPGLERDRESVLQLVRSVHRGPGGGLQISGCADVLGLAPGRIYPMAAWGQPTLLVTRTRHQAVLPDPEARGEARRAHYVNTFAGVPGDVPFQPPPIAKPSALTDWALVVSTLARDPIDADGQGRVRVHLHYDRRAAVTADQRSPWIPVCQAWAGPAHGVQILPREGMVARIEYLQADPDRPVVAGCFAMGRNVPPVALPEDKARLTLRSHSLRDSEAEGDDRPAAEGAHDRHFNELALDDRAEDEEVWLRAGRDFRRRVLRDEHTDVHRDDARLVGGRQALHVLGARTKAVDGGEVERVGGSRDAAVGHDDERTVAVGDRGAGGSDTLDVRASAHARIRGDRDVAVTRNDDTRLRNGRRVHIRGGGTSHATGTRTTTADVQLHARQGRSSLALAGGDVVVAPHGKLALTTASGALVMDPGGDALMKLASLRLICGSSRISLGAGQVGLQSPSIVARGVSGQLSFDAQGATICGENVTSSAVMLNEIKGVPVIFSDTPGTLSAYTASGIHVDTRAGTETPLSFAPAAGDLVSIKISVLDDDLTPAEGVEVRLTTPAGRVLTGRTDGAGTLEAVLPPGIASVQAVFFPDPSCPEGEPT
jgi:uncharacterized protein involved in type VI secretion and phage assembly